MTEKSPKNETEPRMNLTIVARRLEMVTLHYQSFDYESMLTALQTKYKVSRSALQQDWHRRDEWLPVVLAYASANKAFGNLMGKLQAQEEALWTLYRKALKENQLNAAVGAMKQLCQLHGSQAELMMASGKIPVAGIEITKTEHLKFFGNAEEFWRMKDAFDALKKTQTTTTPSG